MRAFLYVGAAIVGATSTSVCLAQTFQDPAGACSVALQSAELVVERDQKYKYSYFATSEEQRAKVNVGIDVVGKLTGALGIDGGKVSSTVNQTMESSDQFYLAARWLPPEQITTYVQCLEKTSNGSPTLYVTEWNNDEVRIQGFYRPFPSMPQQIPLRNVLRIEGTQDDRAALAQFSATLNGNGNVDVRLVRARNPSKRFRLSASFLDKQISISLPILPEAPCLSVDQLTGACLQYAEGFVFHGGPSSEYKKTFPPFTAKGATVRLFGSAVFDPTADRGAAGQANFSWTLGSQTARPFEVAAMPAGGGERPYDDSARFELAGHPPHVTVTIKQTGCARYGSPQTIPALCYLKGFVIVEPDR